MIEINNKKVTCIISRLKKISEVWANTFLVWSSSDEQSDGAISCFSKGYWIKEKPWMDSLSWKNN